MTGHKKYIIRKMTAEDVEFAMQLAKDEGWNPGLNDAKCFFAADPEGFFIGELIEDTREEGEKLAGGAGVSDDGKLAGGAGVSDDGKLAGGAGVSDDGKLAGGAGVSDDGKLAGGAGVSDSGKLAGGTGVSDDGKLAGGAGSAGLAGGAGMANVNEDIQKAGSLEEKIAQGVKRERISVISAVKYGDEFGFIGLYIVKPEYRKNGYGMKIWKVASDYLKNVKSGLDGVVAQQGNYEKDGYKFYMNQFRYEGENIKGYRDSRIVNLQSFAFEKVSEYDRKVVGYDRSRFLKEWIHQVGVSALGFEEDGRLRGIGVIRKCFSGYKIGMLFADDGVIAEKIFYALAETANGEKVYLDVPEKNYEAYEFAKEKLGKYVFETARMYKGGVLNQDVSKIFGVTTFELG